MARIVWRLGALDDLEHLRAYIAEDKPRAADGVRNGIVQAIARLATHPQLGRPGRVPGTRELVIGGTPFIVPYWQPRPGEIEILAVIHGARRWPDRL
jgi:toxin ParE1/3/4